MPAAPELHAALTRAGLHPARLRALLRDHAVARDTRFRAGADVAELIAARAAVLDTVIVQLWRQLLGADAMRLALAATGGYGRGELHPHSDVDLLILTPEAPTPDTQQRLAQFLTLLWDIGLAVGHSVRTPDECVSAAQTDIGTATNLMEARLLFGAADLLTAMQTATGPEQVWPVRDFFAAKWREQTARHARFHDTAYRLEPNIKEGPGGLRDIQMIGWVAQRQFGARTLAGLAEHGFLTDNEYRLLNEGRQFLWRVRYALHMLSGRGEDRLLFDNQIKLAQLFGYADKPEALAVEQFMQRYYRTVMELQRLNEMLLAIFEEAILSPSDAAPEALNERFQIRNGFLETLHDQVFHESPAALLELFLLLQQHPELKGISAATIRQVRRDRHLVDENFRTDPANRALFMAILGEPQGVTHELRRMNRYGILGRYIPAFGAITGRMQYDLFHTYTVDEHILFVVSNLRRFALPRYDHEFPLCSTIMQALPKPEIAYLAGLFHDVAKGRGGDHSELGAHDAEEFCLQHGLSRYEAHLVSWLVQHHLLLSITAQKKDINDPRVLHDFATTVGDQTHLDYLYILTVADVRGTNPELWNSWKASLFRELYDAAKRVLRRGLENPLDKAELIAETQQAALTLLATRRIETDRVQAAWTQLPEEYFLNHTPDEIAWQTEALLAHASARTLIAVHQQTERGGTAVFIRAPQDVAIFSRITAVLDQVGLNILDARIVATEDGQRLHTYLVLEDNGVAIEEAGRVAEIERALQIELGKTTGTLPAVTRRAPRQVRMFSTPLAVTFSHDPRNRRTVLELAAGDRPGLLREIGRAFQHCDIRLQNAKITTVGERAEDVFFLTDRYNQPLDAACCGELETTLREHLGSTP